MRPLRRSAIDVTHLPGVLDPQGATVERALPALGYDNVERGLDRQDDPPRGRRAVGRAAAREQVDEMCQRLLANPVIERYTVEISELAVVGVSVRVGVVVFPGTNCELDVAWAVEQLGGEAELLWHGDAHACATSTRSSCPAASPTATTCAPAPSPASRR